MVADVFAFRRCRTQQNTKSGETRDWIWALIQKGWTLNHWNCGSLVQILGSWLIGAGVLNFLRYGNVRHNYWGLSWIMMDYQIAWSGNSGNSDSPTMIWEEFKLVLILLGWGATQESTILEGDDPILSSWTLSNSPGLFCLFLPYLPNSSSFQIWWMIWSIFCTKRQLHGLILKFLFPGPQVFCVRLWRNCHAAPEPLRYAQICLICSTPISGLSNWPIHANGSKHMPLARIPGGLSTNKQRIDGYSCRHFFRGIHWVHSKNAKFNIWKTAIFVHMWSVKAFRFNFLQASYWFHVKNRHCPSAPPGLSLKSFGTFIFASNPGTCCILLWGPPRAILLYYLWKQTVTRDSYDPFARTLI